MPRKIINISLPQKTAEKVRQEVKKGGYASISEYFRDLIREQEENRILMELFESEAEFRAGKGKLLRSLKDLR